jgi:hypothetical protein
MAVTIIVPCALATFCRRPRYPPWDPQDEECSSKVRPLELISAGITRALVRQIKLIIVVAVLQCGGSAQAGQRSAARRTGAPSLLFGTRRHNAQTDDLFPFRHRAIAVIGLHGRTLLHRASCGLDAVETFLRAVVVLFDRKRCLLLYLKEN